MKLYEARALKLWTGQMLASASRVSRATIYGIENGRTRPTFDTMRKLAGALGVEPLEIDEFRAEIERLSEEQRDENNPKLPVRIS